MRLKSIKLAGFKSFVDATTVPFSSNMTAIVGPNGCGKSNIIDAVRWVMGESSAKNLRGESMTDVIFNGSTGRQPVGQATIELLFDNTEGRLSGEYAAFSEISIRRKVTREGVSQYYLNGSKCRRRDVTDIFLGTGMGPRSYAIIEQGMISKLIESKPEELRVYLEEAAGISKYKERRRETENRMRRTQDNLDRLADIREELGKQLQHLKRQANAAERYAEYKKEERLNTAKLNAIHWQDLSNDFQGKQAQIREFELKIEDAVLAKNTNENQVDSLRTLIEEEQSHFNAIQAKYYQCGAQIATLEQQLQFQKNRLNEQKNSLQLLKQEAEDLTLSLDEENQRLEQVNFELEDIVLEIEEAEAKSEQLSCDLELKSRDLDKWQADWEAFNHQNASARQAAELAQSKIQEHETRLRELSIRSEKLSVEQESIHSQISELDVTELQEESLILSEQLDTSIEKIFDLEPEIQAKASELDSLKNQKNDVYKTLSEQKAILASLNTLQQGALGEQPEKVDALMAELGFSSLTRLLEQLTVSANWELAVEQVLSEWLNAVVFTHELNSEEQSGFYQKLKQGNLSISFIDTPLGSEPNIAKAITGNLADYVSGVGGLSVDLKTIKTADNLEQALSLRQSLNDNESVITQDGYWFGRTWVKYYYPQEEQSGLLVRSKRIQALEESILALEDKLIYLESLIEQGIDILTSLNSELNDVKQLKSIQENDLRKIEQAISGSQAKYDQFKLRLTRAEEDISEVKLQKEVYTSSLEEIRSTWQESMVQLEQFSEEREHLLDMKERVIASLDEVRFLVKDARDTVHQKQLLQQQKESQKMLLVQTLQRLNIELEQRRSKIQKISENDSVDDELIEDLALQLEGFLETRLINEEKLNGARKKVEDLTASLKEEEFKRNSFESHISSAKETLASLRMEAQALSINQNNLLDKIRDDDFSLDEVIEQLTDEDSTTSLTETLTNLAVKISRLGSINLAAIEEYQVQNERKIHLDEQNDDLMDALETLLTAIKKIDKETRTRFKETYDQVNEGLQKLFPKIFGGGSAYLELTDDNLLETGVQIIARPPGKKNATIHLLSGGEKSLTAIALIFAIFELNPAPFCMLDEVDAPLDDANVGRFAHIVKEMSSQVQFIYISHNKVSMERADQLMGVTMHEPGVSRLVSVDIEQAAAMVESI
jgi:chromosome segregation protein